MTLKDLIRRSIDQSTLLAIVVAGCIFSGSLLGLANFVDNKARQREVIQVGHAVEMQEQLLAEQFPGQIDWDEAIANLDNRYDEAWATTNIGHYFCGTLHFDAVYVLDANDQFLFGMTGSTAQDASAFEPLRASSAPLLQSIRAQEAQRGRFIGPFRTSGGDISRPIQANGIAAIGPLTYVIMATLVQPSNGDALPAGPRSPVVVGVKLVDDEFLRPIAQGLQLSNLHLKTAHEHASASYVLQDPHGEHLATIAWSPDRPGRELIQIAFFPILLAVLLPLWFYFHGRRISSRLSLAMRELEDVSASVPGVIFSFARDLDRSTYFPFASPAIFDVVGLQPDDVASDAYAFISRIHRDDLRWLRARLERSARAFLPWGGELRYFHPTKGERWIEFSSRPRLRAEGGLVWHGFAADVTDRKTAEATLRNAAAVLANTGEEVVVTDPNGLITSVNPAFMAISGFAQEEVIGQNMRILRSERYDRAFFASLWSVTQEKGSWQGELWTKHRDGIEYPKWMNFSTVHDKRGRTVGYVATLTDIRQLKATERRLEELATHDALTGLPNRLVLHSRLGEALARARRQNVKGAVLFLDLDRFKTINDSLGHSAGDQLLCIIGTRLRARLRENDTLARVGGDEFVIVLEDLPTPEYASHVARALIDQVLRPVVLGDAHEIIITTSVGISIFPNDGLTAEELIRNADAALYLAKDEGRGSYRFFTEELTQFASARLDLETRLRRAIDRQEFELYYQPIVSLQDRRIIGFEALVRWQDPERGVVGPIRFIPLAEETGLIVPIGEWVLQRACAQMKTWRDLGLTDVAIAVNLSPVQFRHGNMVALIQQTLEDTGLPAEALEVEITEGALMHSVVDAESKLHRLRRMGVRVSMDDFGTGYSSLVYLKQFPIDILKIDRNFVSGIGHDQTDEQIIIALVSLARSLNFECVAEGVETEEQAEFLLHQGCENGQGFLFKRPAPAEQIEEFLTSQLKLI